MWLYTILLAVVLYFTIVHSRRARKTPYLINNADCWPQCNKTGGSCPVFCGEDGYCCRKGYYDCIKIYRDVASWNHHKCVRGNALGSTEITPKEQKRLSVDGNFGEWSRWGWCTKDCGGGWRRRGRRCNIPAPKYGGKNCVGADKESTSCNTHVCPTHGRYGKWSSWSKCTKECGSGIRFRGRECDSPAPRDGGEKCHGPARLAGYCNVHNCPNILNGTYGEWSSWTNCSKSCGRGTKWRTRECDKLAAKKTCIRAAIEGNFCNVHKCPIDGKYGYWSRWSWCTKRCGGGLRLRERKCDKPEPEYGGKECLGPATEAGYCNEHHCPIDDSYEWSSWTKCSKSCGSGTRWRMRQCQWCNRPKIGAEICNVHNCTIDGKYGEWSSWTNCTADCGGGLRFQKRICDSPAPKYGGKKCVGPDTVDEVCNIHNCTSIDGKYGEWSNWTKCSKSCGGGLQFRERACDKPAPKYNGKNCAGPPSGHQSCHIHNCSG